MAPRQTQEETYQFVPMVFHKMYVFYQEEDEIEGIDEGEHPKQDQPPSPLNDPHEDSEDQHEEERPGHTRQTLKERLQEERIANEADPTLKVNL